MHNKDASSYVLITPCRDEANYIEGTLKAVTAQTMLPKKWVIVSDGSVDGTEEIVERYAAKYDFIQLLRRDGDQQRNFGSKVRAFALGYEYVKGLNFDFIGSLDADITMEPTYYEGILPKFEANERLGIAGGVRYDLYNGQFRKVHAARNSIGGSVQFFRRKCYETIGGYRPYRFGGIDAVAETMVRMHGWEVEAFPEFKIYHYRSTGTAGGNVFNGNFRKGMQHYVIGYHPLFQTASCILNFFSYPAVMGSLAVFLGYFWAMYKRFEKEVPDDFISYLRSEQLTRLRMFFITGNSS
jgi:glycosyltransferase involved in cell wall biosynthesis